QNVKINSNIPEPATPIEEKEAVIIQSSQKDVHKAVVMDKDTLPPGAQPLVIIDGNISPDDALNKLDPQEILSIEVIKDAAAHNNYGAKSQYGIIKVTTI